MKSNRDGEVAEEKKGCSSGIDNRTPPVLKVEAKNKPPPIKLGMLALIQKMQKPAEKTENSIHISRLEENSIE